MKVLVPVDGSTPSMQGVHAALNLAKINGAQVCLLNVIPPMTGFHHELSSPQRQVVTQSLLKHAEEIMKTAKDAFLSNGIMPRSVIKAHSNSVANEICEFVESEKIDLVIIGRKGLKPVEQALMGSVTARVIGCSPSNVLVVPSGSTLKWKKILLATDGSPCSDVAVESAVELARLYGGEQFKIVSAVDVPEVAYAENHDAMDALLEPVKELVRSVEDRIKAAGFATESLVTIGDPYRIITGVAREWDADMVCMGSYGHTGPGKFFVGAVAERVIGVASCPVLLAKMCETS